MLLFLPTSGGLQNYGYTSTGGEVDGGSAVFLRSAGFLATGGDVDGGAAVALKSAGIITAGGDIDGGDASIVGTLGRSAGVAAMPDVLITNGKLSGRITDNYYRRF
jgi:hypothetical protein